MTLPWSRICVESLAHTMILKISPMWSFNPGSFKNKLITVLPIVMLFGNFCPSCSKVFKTGSMNEISLISWERLSQISFMNGSKWFPNSLPVSEIVSQRRGFRFRRTWLNSETGRPETSSRSFFFPSSWKGIEATSLRKETKL